MPAARVPGRRRRPALLLPRSGRPALAPTRTRAGDEGHVTFEPTHAVPSSSVGRVRPAGRSLSRCRGSPPSCDRQFHRGIFAVSAPAWRPASAASGPAASVASARRWSHPRSLGGSVSLRRRHAARWLRPANRAASTGSSGAAAAASPTSDVGEPSRVAHLAALLEGLAGAGRRLTVSVLGRCSRGRGPTVLLASWRGATDCPRPGRDRSGNAARPWSGRPPSGGQPQAPSRQDLRIECRNPDSARTGFGQPAGLVEVSPFEGGAAPVSSALRRSRPVRPAPRPPPVPDPGRHRRRPGVSSTYQGLACAGEAHEPAPDSRPCPPPTRPHRSTASRRAATSPRNRATQPSSASSSGRADRSEMAVARRGRLHSCPPPIGSRPSHRCISADDPSSWRSSWSSPTRRAESMAWSRSPRHGPGGRGCPSATARLRRSRAANRSSPARSARASASCQRPGPRRAGIGGTRRSRGRTVGWRG